MCNFLSGIALKNGEDVTVLMSLETDSHTELRTEFKVGEDAGKPTHKLSTPVELVPIRGILADEDYDFVFDAGRPAWWTEEMTVSARRQMFRFIREHLLSESKLSRSGNLYLSSLTALTANAKLSAGGNLYLRSLTALPANAKVTAQKVLLK